MGGLYDAGWRQGSLIEASLGLSSVTLGDAGPRVDTVSHDRWLVATQDCDLDLTDSLVEDPVIELRPVYADDPPADWGIRSARPVPDHRLGLAKAIAEEVGRRPRREVGERVRDVLMQFSNDEPPRYSLFAVLAEASDERRAREWLASIAQSVPVDLGVADELEAAAANRISLKLIETSYAADVTQLTWRGRDPQGAA